MSTAAAAGPPVSSSILLLRLRPHRRRRTLARIPRARFVWRAAATPLFRSGALDPQVVVVGRRLGRRHVLLLLGVCALLRRPGRRPRDRARRLRHGVGAGGGHGRLRCRPRAVRLRVVPKVFAGGAVAVRLRRRLQRRPQLRVGLGRRRTALRLRPRHPR